MRWDYYVFAPNGQKFRSNVEIKTFLRTNPSVKCDLDVTNTSRVDDLEKNYSTMKRQKSETFNRRLRRVRCKTCEACLVGDCKQCVYCKDMTRYGGPGRMKQTCKKRRCLDPKNPVETTSESWVEDKIMKNPPNNQLKIIDDQVKLVHEEKKPIKSIIMQINDGFEESGFFVKSETDIKTPEITFGFSESASNFVMSTVSSDPLDITVHEEKENTSSTHQITIVKHFASEHEVDKQTKNTEVPYKMNIVKVDPFDTTNLNKYVSTTHEANKQLINPDSKRKKIYKCSICLKVMTKIHDLKIHLSRSHGFKCQFCPLRFVLKRDMYDHVKFVH